MIEFNRFVLANGLRVLVHEDTATPMAVVNVMYDVGARDENPAKTGFAHLFEHLMFGGSKHIPDYDEPLQRAGGENNAYTTDDLTNYYCQLPAENIEMAFWLESDRMLNLAFSKKSLEVQRKVVCEEFKEHYINKPYGDMWHKMRALSYQVHPYQWLTIGKELSHIEQVQLDEVKAFFCKHYRPINAILVVAGNVKTEEVKHLAEKWFGDIPMGEKYVRHLPAEPEQTAARSLEVTADVPLDALMKTWHMDGRLQQGYYVADLITEILGGGSSSRLYQSLVKEQQLFSDIQCYQLGSIDPGLVTIQGKLVKGVAMQQAETAVNAVIQQLAEEPVSETELMKIKNRTESVIVFEDMALMNRANSLAYYELMGDAGLINEELNRYHAVTIHDIQQGAATIFTTANVNTLYYYSKTL